MSANSDTVGATYRPRSRRAAGSAPVRRGTLFHRLFLSRFSIGAKLLLSTCIVVVPLAAFGAFCMWIEFKEWRVAATEANAIHLYEPVHEIVHAATQSTELTQARIRGEPLDRTTSAALLKQLQEAHREFTTRLAAHSHDEVQRYAEELTKRMNMLAADAASERDGFPQYSAVVESALALEEQIAFESGLFRDSDELVSAYSEVGLRRIPRMLNDLSEAYTLLSAPNVLRENGQPAARLQYLAVILSDRALESQGQLVNAAHILASRRPSAKPRAASIEPPRALQSLFDLPDVLRAAHSENQKLPEMLTLIHSAEQALGQLQDQLIVDLGTRLEKHKAEVTRDAWIAFALSVPALTLGAWLTYAISSRTAGGVRRLLSISNGIAQGRYDHMIDEQGSDELSRLFAGFAEMQRRLSLQIGTERAQLVISNRIRAALDNVAGNVLVGAASGAIVHANKAALVMLREAQNDIRIRIPDFDIESLHGTSLDAFCDTLIGESLGLITLSATLTREFEVGNRTFKMVANPVLSEGGERFGTVVELTDRTSEIAVERELQDMLAAVVDGKLDKRIQLSGKRGFFETMSRGVNHLAENMSDVVLKVKSVASRVREVSNEISEGNSDLTRRFESQSQSLNKTSALMINVTQAAKRNADSAGHADELVTTARGQAERGGQVVKKAVSAMAEINDSAGRIADIIGVVDEIAFQTNLLALNAAVEAARAGEQGRGFAVVAAEVRSLAGRSAAAAKEIKGLIEDSVFKVEIGSALVRQSGETLEHIVASVGKVSQIVAEIAAASREQTSGIAQVNEAVGQIEEMTQHNASVVEQAALSSEAMAAEARELTTLIERFRMDSQAERSRVSKPLRELASVA